MSRAVAGPALTGWVTRGGRCTAAGHQAAALCARYHCPAVVQGAGGSEKGSPHPLSGDPGGCGCGEGGAGLSHHTHGVETQGFSSSLVVVWSPREGGSQQPLCDHL